PTIDKEDAHGQRPEPCLCAPSSSVGTTVRELAAQRPVDNFCGARVGTGTMLRMGTQGGRGSTTRAQVMSVLAGQQGVADVAQLVAAGASREELRRMVRRGELVRVRRDTL